MEEHTVKSLFFTISFLAVVFVDRLWHMRKEGMDMDIRVWMQEFVKRMEAVFGEELWLIGLQGSYGRQEATAESDIDVVVI